MTTFDERESAFENKFAHDAEAQFRAESIRNKMIAQWAVQVMGRPPEDAEAYAREIIHKDFERPGHEDVVEKLVEDMGDATDEATIRQKMAEFLDQARAKILAGD